MTDDLTEQDLTALRECMAIAKRDGRSEELESMLAEPRPWAEVAKVKCQCVQSRVLRLRARESPPCAPGDKAAAKLLRKMLAAGVSRYDPNPVAALLAALEEQRRAQRRKSKR